MAKSVINWHSNTERLQKKEQERLEKERLKALMVCNSIRLDPLSCLPVLIFILMIRMKTKKVI